MSGSVRGVEALLYGKNIVTLLNRKRGATGNTKYAYVKEPYYVYSTKELVTNSVTEARQFLSCLESGCEGVLQRIIAILGQL